MSIYNLNIFKKSTLIFEVPSNQSSDRDIRGNRKNNTTLQQITVQLYQDRSASQQANEASTNEIFFYTGYMVEPATIPSELRIGAVGSGVINGKSYTRVELQATASFDLTIVDKVFQEPISVRCTNHIKWGTNVLQE